MPAINLEFSTKLEIWKAFPFWIKIIQHQHHHQHYVRTLIEEVSKVSDFPLVAETIIIIMSASSLFRPPTDISSKKAPKEKKTSTAAAKKPLLSASLPLIGGGRERETHWLNAGEFAAVSSIKQDVNDQFKGYFRPKNLLLLLLFETKTKIERSPNEEWAFSAFGRMSTAAIAIVELTKG